MMCSDFSDHISPEGLPCFHPLSRPLAKAVSLSRRRQLAQTSPEGDDRPTCSHLLDLAA